MSYNRRKPKRHIRKGLLPVTALVCVLIAGVILLVNSGKKKERTEITAAPAVETASPSPSPTPLVGEVNGVLQAPFNDVNSVLVIANKKHHLPDGYEPSDLRTLNVTEGSGYYLRDEAATALENMFAAALKDGVTLLPASAYRSQAYQEPLYNGYVQQYGKDEADTISSRPGYSDHQTGLAIDIADHDRATVFTADMENTPEGKWLYEHAHEYGFVLRYPKGKDAITGYTFEPWHYRYIGVQNATDIWNVSPDETIEEYYGISGGDYAD